MTRMMCMYLAALLALTVGGCSALIDVDDYAFEGSTGGTTNTGGSTATGGSTNIGGTNNTGGIANSGGAPNTGGITNTGGIMPMAIRANLQTLQAQFTTGCVPSGADQVPGEEYVITIVPGTPHKLRRDLINYTSGCEVPLWVEVLEGPVELVALQGSALETGLKVTVERYALKFVHETAAEGARDEMLFGIDSWQMNTWHSLLGVETLIDDGGDNFAVNAGDQLFLRVEIVKVAEGEVEEVEFSYPVFDSLPASTDFVAKRTDGKEGVDVRFPINN